MASLAAAGESVAGSVRGVASEYQASAGALQGAARESTDKTVSAARDLSQRMAEVAKLAGRIEDVLHLQESIDGSLQRVSSAAEFEHTLADLRKHLATTDALCSQLSKPRVITLSEERVDSGPAAACLSKSA